MKLSTRMNRMVYVNGWGLFNVLSLGIIIGIIIGSIF